MQLLAVEVGPFEAHELSATQPVIEEERQHEPVPFVVDDGDELLELPLCVDLVVPVAGLVVLWRRDTRGIEVAVGLLEEADEAADAGLIAPQTP